MCETAEIDNNYRIVPYILHELGDRNIVVQNAKGIVRSNEDRIKNFLKKYDEHGNSLVSFNEIETIFNEDTVEAIQFLELYNIIEKRKHPNFNIKRIKVFTNYKDIGEHLNEILLEDYSHMVEVSYFYDKNLRKKHITVAEGDLILVFMNPYNRKIAKEIRDLGKDCDQSFLFFTYVYNNNFYMDALYNDLLKSPCHICHISYIESQLRIKNKGNITYQNMIDSLYSENELFSVYTPLNLNQQFNITTNIVNYLSRIVFLDQTTIVHSEAFLESAMLDLSSKTVTLDNPIHWELCDCYE